MKKLVRLTEGDLHKIVKESVKRVLNEDVRTYSADELRQKWNDTGNSYKYAHPTRNGIDMHIYIIILLPTFITSLSSLNHVITGTLNINISIANKTHITVPEILDSQKSFLTLSFLPAP